MTPIKDLKVASVMTPAPERLPHDFTVAEAARFLLDEGISGAPVVGRDGLTMSVLSTTDLLRAITGELFQGEPGSVSALRRRGIGEVVQRSAVTCPENTLLTEACGLMVRNGVHRVIVTRDGQPVGIVSSLDAAGVLAGMGGSRTDSSPGRGFVLTPDRTGGKNV